MSSLRSKKNLEDILDKRLATLHQLQTVLTSIDTAQNDVEIMGAYETATKTLKGVLAHPSLDLAKVERTTEEMAEALASQEEIDQAIRVGGAVAVGAGGVVIDDDELEKELEGLVIDEQQKQKEREEAEKQRMEVEKQRSAKEREEKERAQRVQAAREQAKAQSTGHGTSQGQAGQTDTAKDDWQKTYDEAQRRKVEEAQRAEIERMNREERRVAAE